MAHSLHLHTVAEGAETCAQLALLHRLGCHNAQGHGIAAPMPAAQMQDWLTHRRDTPPAWLLHQALAPLPEEDADQLVDEARSWLRRAVRSGSMHAAGMLGDTLNLEVDGRLDTDPAQARRWLMRAAARGDERSETGRHREAREARE